MRGGVGWGGGMLYHEMVVWGEVVRLGNRGCDWRSELLEVKYSQNKSCNDDKCR